MLFLKRGAPLRVVDRVKHKDDNLPPNLWEWVKANVFTQPGQRASSCRTLSREVPRPIGIPWHNPRFDCLLEIYQGARSATRHGNLPDKRKTRSDAD